MKAPQYDQLCASNSHSSRTLLAERNGRLFSCPHIDLQPTRAFGETRADMTFPERERNLRQHPPNSVRQPTGWSASRCAALVTLCVLCYSNSIHGELVHDDVWAIINNPDVRPSSSLRNIFTNDFWGKRMSDNSSHKSYRPFCILTFKYVHRTLLRPTLKFIWCRLRM